MTTPRRLFDAAQIELGILPYETLTQVVSFPLVASSSVTYAPAVIPGAASISVPIVTESAIFEPTVAAGPASISLDLFSSTSISLPIVSPGKVTITFPLVRSSVVIYQPSVISRASVLLDLLSSSAAVPLPSVSPAAVQILIGAPSASAQIFSFSVQAGGGAQVVALPFTSTGAVIQSPTVAASAEVTLPLVSSGAIFSPALVASSAVALSAVTSTALVETPAVLSYWPIAVSPVVSSQVFAPAVVVGPASVTVPILTASAVFMPEVRQRVELFRVDAGATFPPTVALVDVIVLQVFGGSSIFSFSVVREEVGTTKRRLDQSEIRGGAFGVGRIKLGGARAPSRARSSRPSGPIRP